jgi:hypothetical protein
MDARWGDTPPSLKRILLADQDEAVARHDQPLDFVVKAANIAP